MDKLFVFIKKYSRIILALFIIFFLTAGLLWFIYKVLNPPITVVAEFNELGPLYKKMPVYYKGYKIGNTSKIRPSKDFRTTLVTIVFYPDELKLPENIAAKVKRLNSGVDYLNLEYPEKPSKKLLKTGSVIHGMTSLDIQSFMSAQVESGALGSITENVDSALATFDKVGKDASILINTLTATVNENRASIKKSVNNLNKATESVNRMALKLDNALNSEKIETATTDIGSTIQNIEQTSDNIKEITANIEVATKDLNRTMASVDSTLCQLNGAATNINAITAGIRKTLNQNLAAFKLLFSNPLKNSGNNKNCCVK